jgi:hypothetical protein
MNEQTEVNDKSRAEGQSRLNAGLGLPWHIGFSSEIADQLCEGNYQPDLVRYEVFNICDYTGKVRAFATSLEAANTILKAVNVVVPNV